MTTPKSERSSYLSLRPLIRTASSASDDRSNLFVRLSPTTAWKIHDIMTDVKDDNDDADPSSLTDGRNDDHSSFSRWLERLALAALPTTVESGVEFVPLEITWDDHTRIYVSYNGGDIDMSAQSNEKTQDDADHCIEIPWELLPREDTCCLNSVKVQPVHHVATISSLSVEPCTLEDWEWIELDAAWLEQGGLLQQVSIVYTGQILSLRLSYGVNVRLKVLATSENDTTTLWPQRHPHSCWRLAAQTQIVVVPSKQYAAVSPLHWQLVPTREDFMYYDPSLLSLAVDLAVDLMQVPQGTALVHPVAYNRLRGTGYHDEIQTDETNQRYATIEAANERVTVRIDTSELVPKDAIALHPLARMKIKVPMFASFQKISIKLLSAFEFEQMVSILSDQVFTPPDGLVLVPATVLEQGRTLQPWRHPEVTDNRSIHFICDSELRSLDSQLELLTQSTIDFPLEIGSFLSLETKNDEFTVVQLVLQSEPNEQRVEELAQGFVLAHRLAGLLKGKPRDSSTFTFTDLPIIDLAQQPSTVQRLLPTESIFSSSLLRLLEGAANRSDIVLHGERGCGKTFTAMAIAASLRLVKGCNAIYMDCRRLKNYRQFRMNDILTQISSVFIDAVDLSPCAIIFDDLDELTPSFESVGSSDDTMQLQQVNPIEIDQSKLISDVLINRMRTMTHGVSFVVTCRSENSLPVSILRERKLDIRVAVPAVEEADRELLFYSLLRRKGRHVATPNRRDAEFARKTVGFRPRDLEQLALRLYRNQCLHNGLPTLAILDTASELDKFIPLSRLGATLEKEANVNLSDVGGLFQAKSDLCSIVLQPFRYRRIYARAKIRLPRGILLYGPPGTGKTMCGPALARECGLPLIMCRGPEFLDRYIGASEAKVRELFSRAASAAPSILFIDELDALAPRRGSDHSGVTDRVVNQLLTFLDGVENTSDKGQVYVVATSSRPDKIDPALLRPGRLEKHVYFGFAESDDEVSDLLSSLSKHYNLDSDASKAIRSGELVKTLRHDSFDFSRLSAADWKAAFNTSQLSAVHEAIASGCMADKVTISCDHLMQSIRSLRPSLLRADFDRLEEVYAVYRSPLPFRPSNRNKAKPLLTALK